MEDNKNPFRENDENKEIEDIKTEEQEKDSVETSAEVKEENKEAQEKEEIKTQEKDELQEKYDDLNNKYIRLAADFDNFRKRTIQEKDELSKYATSEVLKKLTTVLDTFDRAQEHLKEIDNPKTVKESYELAFKQLIDTLKKIGMEEIEALGQDFDPNLHEAITQIQTDEFEPDTVAVVAQKGYKYADKIIRPALVGVAKKKDNE